MMTNEIYGLDIITVVRPFKDTDFVMDWYIDGPQIQDGSIIHLYFVTVASDRWGYQAHMTRLFTP